MPGGQRIGLWFGRGLDNAIAARAALGRLQAEHPGADWVLFGPRKSLFLFEMDDRVPAYIPLKSLEPRRPAQSRLSYYLEKRAQFKTLRGLKLDLCIGISAVAAQPELNQQVARHFQHVLKMLGTGGHLIQQELPWFLQIERPLLQAGPQALAFATQFYRKVPPNQAKCLLLLEHVEGQFESLDLEWRQAQQAFHADLTFAASNVHHATAVLGDWDRLSSRQLSQTHPDWLQLDVAQAMGLIAYADRVICSPGSITRICAEMGRSERVLLGKSHS